MNKSTSIVLIVLALLGGIFGAYQFGHNSGQTEGVNLAATIGPAGSAGFMSIYNSFESLLADVRGLRRTVTWDPAATSVGSSTYQAVTVGGAALGDRVEVTSSVDLASTTLTGYVSAANTVQMQLSAHNAAADIGSGSFTVIVFPATLNSSTSTTSGN